MIRRGFFLRCLIHLALRFVRALYRRLVIVGRVFAIENSVSNSQSYDLDPPVARATAQINFFAEQ